MSIVKRKTFKYICLLASLCAFLISGCGIMQKSEKNSPKEDETQHEEKEKSVFAVKSNKKEKTQEVQFVPTDREKEENGEETMILPPPPNLYKKQHGGKPPIIVLKPEPVTDTKPFWQSENTMQGNNLKSIAAAAQHYYDAFGEKQGWISKNGRMCSYPGGVYMTTDRLASNGYLERGLSASGYDILLVSGNDLAQYAGTDVPVEDKGFGVFAAMQQSDGRYLLASPSGKVGLLSRKDYTALLSSYGQNHGDVIRLSSASTEYGRILGFLGLYEGELEEYFVREIRKDDKYAVVTFSDKANTAYVKQHILRNDNNFWEVVYPNVQTWYYAAYRINQTLPDFNFELLPRYNIGSVAAGIKAGDPSIVNAMVAGGYVADQSQIYYQCVYKDYGYVVTHNGARYVAYQEQGKWRILHVASDYEAKNFISARTGQDYGFIILDD